MINRERIVEAAARVYAQHGFRGATTRLIAQEAGVNEVTLFRIFGSKSALLDEVIRGMGEAGVCPQLPARPENPERELIEWAESYRQGMSARRSLIRTTMGELEERPDVGGCIARGPMRANGELRAYIERLQRVGFADPSVDVVAPAAMLMGALFGDAMGRDMMPGMYPPAAQAARQYTRCFLRAIGARSSGVRSPRGRVVRATRNRKAS